MGMPRKPHSIHSTILIFIIWWIANNWFAIDTEVFFTKFNLQSYAIDLTFTQGVLGVILVYTVQFIRNRLNEDSLVTEDSQQSAVECSHVVDDRWCLRVRVLDISIGILHTVGSFLTILSYSSIGAVSTLIWKLTESFFAVVMKVVMIGSVPIENSLAVGMVLSGVITFSIRSFQFAQYLPIITSNFIFPLRNVLIKLKENPGQTSEDRYYQMLKYGIPLSTASLIARYYGTPFQAISIPYIFRNATYYNVYQFSSILLLSRVDNVSHSILNTFKRFTGIVVTILLFRSHIYREQTIGIFLSFTGFTLYAFIQKSYFPFLNSKISPVLRKHWLILALSQLFLPIIIWNICVKDKTNSLENNATANPLQSSCPKQPRFSHTVLDFRPNQSAATLQHYFPWDDVSFQNIERVLSCNSFSDCNSALLQTKHYLNKTIIHLVLDHCAENSTVLFQTIQMCNKIFSSQVRKINIYGLNLCTIHASGRNGPEGLSREQIHEFKIACHVCHKIDAFVHGEETAVQLEPIFRSINVVGNFQIWKTDDVRLGRTLNSKYRTLKTKIDRISFLASHNTNISVLVSLSNDFGALQSLDEAQSFDKISTQLRIGCNRTTHCYHRIKLHPSETTTSLTAILGKRPNQISKKGIPERHPDLYITSYIDEALKVLSKGIPIIFITDDGYTLESVKKFELPYLHAKEFRESSLLLSLLRQGLTFNMTSFEKNLCRTARQLIEMHPKFEICLKEVINVVASMC